MLNFTPKEGDFTVAFPSPPKVGFHMLLDGKERLYTDNEGDRLFMVTASTFIFGAKDDQEAFDRRMKRFADNAGATRAASPAARASSPPPRAIWSWCAWWCTTSGSIRRCSGAAAGSATPTRLKGAGSSTPSI